MSKIGKYFARPSVFHSVVFGTTAGLLFYSTYIGWRAIKVKYLNTEYFARQSRWRYMEKQQLYQRELSQRMNANYIASIAEEYDPVALRMPGSKVDPKHMF
ncbi:conserved hypothetical protein [Theileria equi strain WA]|uniref:Uncharacterized protein n=1 Tax=Theileria equi strain WA TaxID=1537102 RepID=L1LCK3_THEEQ|nr:conserved hypothetical protein [Theileria equi strain WA]EKX73167.1 conserved hypothetical protein [Theileria equi strain WA]|eukprot:XP_004832619.1 conserved hypothetical protein [Theileria equi strain WA]